ncbi:hypothetical protein BD311DRAFT_740175 [Dichomitus squalens]|uniref:Uncharacterized protein n=1 Tax=Dichomitus squalens TaxID=114155 RepID=A0A4Q9MI12_9APHY|nr:hypothetical protein BD311DRAFT_740175 [Dichomitus squalens]
MADPGRATTSQHLQRLNGAIEEIEDVRTGCETNLKKTTQALRYLLEENKALRAELKVVVDRLAFVEAVMDIEEEGGNEDRAERAGIGTGEGTGEDIGEGTGNLASEPVLDSKANVVNLTYLRLSGVEKLVKRYLPDYPGEDEEWPLDPATGQRYLCCKWNASARDCVNTEGLTALRDAVQAFGALREPKCAPYLGKILDAHLDARFAAKFGYMAREYRTYCKEQAVQVGKAGEGGADDEDAFGPDRGEHEDAVEGETEAARLQRSIRRTRAVTVAMQRERKAKGTAWDDPRYAGAFLVNAQSDYEDEFKEGDRPAGVPVKSRNQSRQVCFNGEIQESRGRWQRGHDIVDRAR